MYIGFCAAQKNVHSKETKLSLNCFNLCALAPHFFFEFVFCISINRLKFILYNNLNLLWNSKGSVWFDSIRHKLKSVISSNKLYWLYAWIEAHIRMLSVCPNQDILLKHLFGHIPHDATSRQYIRTIKRIKLKRNWLKLFFQPVKRNDLFLYFEQALLSHLYGTERRLKKINFLKFKIFPKKRTLIFLKRVLIFAHTFSSKSTTPNHKLMMENEILIG